MQSLAAGCLSQTVMEGEEGCEESGGIRGLLKVHLSLTTQSVGVQVRLYSNLDFLKGRLLIASPQIISSYFHSFACHHCFRTNVALRYVFVFIFNLSSSIPPLP